MDKNIDLCELYKLRLGSLSSIDRFAKEVEFIVNGLGFSDYQFLRLDRAWVKGSRMGCVHSLSEELSRIYVEERIYEKDLVLSFARTNNEPIFSSEIYSYINDAPFDLELTESNRLVLKLYKRFGYHEHCAIPAYSSYGSGKVLLLVTSKGEDIKFVQSKALPLIPAFQSLCKAIDFITSTKYRSVFIGKNNSSFTITEKPLLVLSQLSSNDITITELAQQMCISPITAHQHIAAARKALGVKTNIGAVTKAFKSGLIKI